MFAAVWHWSRAPNNIPTKVCHAVIAALACLGFLHTVADFSPGFSRIVNGFFDQPSCRRITGSFDNVKWSFNATGQCNTTAQESAIQGAVAEYIRIAENGTVCEIQCLRLDQGGTWNGWLKLGKVSNFSEDAYCGVGLPFDGFVGELYGILGGTPLVPGRGLNKVLQHRQYLHHVPPKSIIFWKITPVLFSFGVDICSWGTQIPGPSKYDQSVSAFKNTLDVSQV
ncbi:hypothetical protein KXV43_004631 [Aspergillus fumigatus]|nr:hypothetical protein KXV43_004631 [Aspergillus fumigatus]